MPETCCRSEPNTTEKTLTERFSREAAAGYDRRIIEDTDVVVVGAGALGQFVMLCLALIGYPRVTCIDMDHFEESNAPRSPFYRPGWPKAKAAAVGARALCTATGDVEYRFGVSMVQRFGDALFRGQRRVAVLSAVDSQTGRLWLAQRCRKLGILMVEGGFHRERWNVSAFLNEKDDGPCWACGMTTVEVKRVFSCDTYARQAERQGFIPATAPGAMSLGAFQVGLMTQILHGNLTLANSTISTDLNQGIAQFMRRETDPSCRVDHRIVAGNAAQLRCGPHDTVATLLQEIERLVADPIVHLPASYIQVAPCVKCRHPVRVTRPEWAINGPPACKKCGGPFPRTRGIPEQHGSLSGHTSVSISDMPLETLGLGPSLHLEVEGMHEGMSVALAEDAGQLLETIGKGVRDGQANRDWTYMDMC